METMTTNDAVVEFTDVADVPESDVLNVSDRCDACGAQAHNVAVSGDSGLRLFLCNHHERKHRSSLQDQNFRVEHHKYSF